MVLILSQNREKSTELVIDWLNFKQIKWFRINETDNVEVREIELTEDQEPKIILNINGSDLDLSVIRSYWYRRGELNISGSLDPNILKIIGKVPSELHFGLSQFLRKEAYHLLSFVYWYLKTYKHSLGDFEGAENRKLQYLVIASTCGLKIPKTKITSNLDNSFFQNGSPLITKSIHEVVAVAYGSTLLTSRTQNVSINDLVNYRLMSIFPSLFQANIRKRIELRIFFIEDRLFPMAIFSQSSMKTETDFRNYDYENPNRNLPFLLPEDIEQKTKLFIARSGLNTGSIDMIMTMENEFYFLEVNPIGQFGMVSSICNYYLEEEIANFLDYESK